MATELRLRNYAQQLYIRALSAAWRNRVQLYEPSVWLLKEPEIEEKMLRDADIAHVVTFRRHLIAGKNWTLVSKNENSPRSDLAVSIGTYLISQIKNFTSARLLLARAFFSGARFGKIYGKTKVLTIGDGKPRMWWVPTKIEDLDKRVFRIVPKVSEDGEITVVWEQWDVFNEEFKPLSLEEQATIIKHIYEDDQASLGYGRGLREALGWWWYAKEHVFAESLQAVERFAQGILTAKVDGVRDASTGLPNQELINQWSEVLEDLRSRHVLVYDQSDSVEMVSMDNTGWQLLSDIRKELRTTIFTLVLGANLTTAADAGGSYALAEIQENSTEALIQYDRKLLEETLTDDLIGCIWIKNHANMVDLGIVDEKPKFSITQEKRQDPRERATVAEILTRMGVDLSLSDVLEQTGFKKPKEGEDVISGCSFDSLMELNNGSESRKIFD